MSVCSHHSVRSNDAVLPRRRCRDGLLEPCGSRAHSCVPEPGAHRYRDLSLLPRRPATFWAVEEIWVSRMPTMIGLVATTGVPPVPSWPL